MAKKLITIGDRTYPTQKAAEAAIREVRDRYRDGDRLDGDDEAFMLAVFARHEDWEQKQGCGIAFITVELTEYKTRAFYIHRVDGSSTDISFKVCLKPRTHRQNVLCAMREAVKPQVWAFRDRTLVPGARCAITNEPLSGEQVHVDHQPPFLEIVQTFLAANGWDFESIAVVGTKDNSVANEFIDDRQRQLWADYHRQHARLRLAKAGPHLRLPR